MATMITGDCINCGACEPECPNNAISQGDPVFVIDPILCTECVGFHDYEACAAVCPVDVCVTDPNNIEPENVLIARARALHPETDFGETFQSRFRKPANGAAVTPPPEAAGIVAAPAAVTEPVPKPVVTPAPAAAAKPTPQPVAVKPAPSKQELRPKKTFPKELSVSFEEATSQYGGGGAIESGVVRLAVILLQPIIGALSHGLKKRLEAAIQSPLFTAAGSTALNILNNAVLYPIIAVVIAVAVHGTSVIFSQDINNYVLVGLLLAAVEGIIRLRDGIFHAKPAEEMHFAAALYGVPLALIAEPILGKYTRLVREVPIPVDGFYSRGFVDKLERERRYGNVYTVEDRGGAFLVKMEFPHCMPDIGVADRIGIADEMPDYDYDLALRDSQLIVKGKCTDEKIRKISSSFGAFPPEFTTVIPLRQKVAGFAHHFENKLLEVLLVKANA